MEKSLSKFDLSKIRTFSEFIKKVDYSFMDSLNSDPNSSTNGVDHDPREVCSGHYVPVLPTPIEHPKYISHSESFFEELGLSDEIIKDNEFSSIFSGDLSVSKYPMKKFGWATGYALSIYGTEYTQQCPFRTGNGYGDGRAISIFEGVFRGKRWEMQLKGGGRTPYCRGGDGRAVLRSSIREFLAQDFMNALGIPTTRSLTLYVSDSENVLRPWYEDNSNSFEPEIMIETPAAITTRVAPSFLRVGQLELFARRARINSNVKAFNELRILTEHLITKNYQSEIDTNKLFSKQLLDLAYLYRERLILLVANWIRVGYCQGNFNSDNCALGGYTLDYGPFGFCELFDPDFQPWTGGGKHFSFFNQANAAELNFQMFINSIRILLKDDFQSLEKLEDIKKGFSSLMNYQMECMWIKKLGLKKYDEYLVNKLISLMKISKVDYTIFFRSLSLIPRNIKDLKKSFYKPIPENLEEEWNKWLNIWLFSLANVGKTEDVSTKMKLVNPKYTWREWLISQAYKEAEKGNYDNLNELKKMFSKPYDDQSNEIDKKYNVLRPNKYFNAGGISHYSCSS